MAFATCDQATCVTVNNPCEEFAPGTEVVIEGLAEHARALGSLMGKLKTFAGGTLTCEFQGLQKFPAFNGLHGTIQLLDKATGRRKLGRLRPSWAVSLLQAALPAACRSAQGYNVQLASTDGPLDQIAKIRGENLRMPLGGIELGSSWANEDPLTSHEVGGFGLARSAACFAAVLAIMKRGWALLLEGKR